MAYQRRMDDDPIMFALKDEASIVALYLTGVILVGAM